MKIPIEDLVGIEVLVHGKYWILEFKNKNQNSEMKVVLVDETST